MNGFYALNLSTGKMVYEAPNLQKYADRPLTVFELDMLTVLTRNKPLRLTEIVAIVADRKLKPGVKVAINHGSVQYYYRRYIERLVERGLVNSISVRNNAEELPITFYWLA